MAYRQRVASDRRKKMAYQFLLLAARANRNMLQEREMLIFKKPSPHYFACCSLSLFYIFWGMCVFVLCNGLTMMMIYIYIL